MPTTTMHTLANNVAGLTLASPYTAGSTTFTLSAGATSFPTTLPCRMTVITAATYQTSSETLTIYEVTAVNTSTQVITITAGPQEGTTDRNYAALDKVDLRFTAAGGNDLNTAVTPIVNTGISAAGTTQGGATVIATPSFFGTPALNIVSTVAANSGVVLPTAVATMKITVVNTGANPLAVYPASGATINASATNIAVTVPVGGAIALQASSTTSWYTTAVGSGPSVAFPTTGTAAYTIPAGASFLEFFVVGGGGGGGSGGCGASNIGGGGGGGGGAASWGKVPVSGLPATLGVQLGAGGPGGGTNVGGSGLPATTSGGAGSNGVVGGASSVYNNSNSANYAQASGGNPGVAGSSATAGTGGSGGISGAYHGGAGAASSLTTTPTAASSGITFGAGGGGGGGGITSGAAGQAGGAAGGPALSLSAGTGGGAGGAAGAPGVIGVAGQSPGLDPLMPFGASGGGGGGATSTSSAVAGNGGAGAVPGGGGGGGGAAISTATTCSVGGNGGAGLVVIFAY